MVVFIILAALAALLSVAFILPVSVTISASTGEKTKIRVFYVFKLFENTEKEEKSPEKEKVKTAEKSVPEKKTEKTDIKEILGIIKELLPSLKDFASKIYIPNIELFVSVAKEDAMETAIGYGRMNAEVHSALAVIKNFFKIKKEAIFIHPDFKGDENTYNLKAKISVRGLYVFLLALSAVKIFIKRINNEERK